MHGPHLSVRKVDELSEGRWKLILEKVCVTRNHLEREYDDEGTHGDLFMMLDYHGQIVMESSTMKAYILCRITLKNLLLVRSSSYTLN